MYNCGACGETSKAGAKLLRHVIRRSNGQTACEVPVCPYCKTHLDSGVPLLAIQQNSGIARVPVFIPTPSPKVIGPVLLPGRRFS